MTPARVIGWSIAGLLGSAAIAAGVVVLMFVMALVRVI